MYAFQYFYINLKFFIKYLFCILDNAQVASSVLLGKINLSTRQCIEIAYSPRQSKNVYNTSCIIITIVLIRLVELNLFVFIYKSISTYHKIV